MPRVRSGPGAIHNANAVQGDTVAAVDEFVRAGYLTAYPQTAAIAFNAAAVHGFSITLGNRRLAVNLKEVKVPRVTALTPEHLVPRLEGIRIVDVQNAGLLPVPAPIFPGKGVQ